jgi:hypothetical protein
MQVANPIEKGLAGQARIDKGQGYHPKGLLTLAIFLRIFFLNRFWRRLVMEMLH